MGSKDAKLQITQPLRPQNPPWEPITSSLTLERVGVQELGCSGFKVAVPYPKAPKVVPFWDYLIEF